MVALAIALSMALAANATPAAARQTGRGATADRVEQPFQVAVAGEAIATVRAQCSRCNWGEPGREAVVLRVTLDGAYSQHFVLVRGNGFAAYRVTLGALASGTHRLVVEPDPALSAHDAGVAIVESVAVDIVAPGSDEYLAQSMAPIVYARPNTIGKFTDIPLLAWYEIVPTARGRQFRYSVIFSNEDGGTETDRLMATWGRTTDIEFVYGVEVDATGRVLREEFQGPGHEVPAFTGRHESRHPLLYVSTDNNMVSESGPARVRYAPAPDAFDLTGVSREIVMDRSPWTYAVTALEMMREGKIGADDAAPRSGKIPDLRRFVHVEACSDLDNAAVVFSVRATDASGTSRWYDSDRGDAAFRIVRSGCFRGAVPVPAGAGRPDAVRFRAYRRAAKDATSAMPRVRLTRVNSIFMLDERFQPSPSLFSWTGSVTLAVDGDWYELSF